MIGKKTWIVLFVAAIVLAPAQGQSRETPKALACRKLETVRILHNLPGYTAALAYSDGSVVAFATGLSANGQPLSPDNKFLSGSIGKTFVAALALDLHERGILDLDGKVSNWLGDQEWYRALPNSDTVTLRDLLTHTSGWPSHVDIPKFQLAISKQVQVCPTCVFSPLDAIKFLDGEPPLFAPGQGWSYSETNYLVAGLVLEQVTGKRYYSLLEDEVLHPLHLNHTTPSDRNEIAGLVAGRIDPTTNYFGLNASSTMRNGKLLYNPTLEWTGGGLASTSSDLARWGQLLYTGRAFAEPYLQDLFVSVPAKPGRRYGLGIDIRGQGTNVSFGHTGSIPGYRSVLRYFPAEKTAVAAQIDADFDNEAPVYADIIAATKQASALVNAGSRPRSRSIMCN